MKDYPDKIFELVIDRPDPTLSKNKPICPYGCVDAKIHKHGSTTTLVAYIGEDRNHVWTSCTCDSCKKEFTLESKGSGKVWYTSNNKVLKGFPGCFESYVLTCKCGGHVHRYHTPLDSDVKTSCISYKDGVPQVKQFFECDTCKTKLQTF